MLHHPNPIQFSSQPTPPSLYPPTTASQPISSQSNPKLRAACDECRLKKLKCTGEQPACSRCVRDGIQCIYSPQKQMGRPKKRQRVEAAKQDGEAFYPRRQEGNLAPPQPTSKPDQVAEKDSGPPPLAMEFPPANENIAAAAADVTTSSDWNSWEDFERFLGNGDDNLPSWLSSNNWSGEIPGEGALPGLIPDYATSFHNEGISPPIPNLPSELLPPREVGRGKYTSNGEGDRGVGKEAGFWLETSSPSKGELVLGTGEGEGWVTNDLSFVPSLLPPNTTTTVLPLDPPSSNPNIQDHHHEQPPSLLPAPSCACLSTLYLTLSTLQQQQPHSSSHDASTTSQTPSFPHTLIPLRTAMQTAITILTCPICPQRFLSAMQNTQLLGTLLVCIAEKFRGMVERIEGEEGKGKGEEWRSWAKGVVWGEIYGRSRPRGRRSGGEKAGRRRVERGCEEGMEDDNDGETEEEGEEEDPSPPSSTSTSSISSSPVATINHPAPIHFLALTKAMYDRQLAWHSSTKEVVDAGGVVKKIPSLPEDFPRDREGRPIGGPSLRKEDHMCLKFRGFAEKLVDGLDWS
ncbi:hypothetical protein KC340_g15141 [Hortaea werneckii]|nr:hypothetical protein KC342_g9292 [Hortaea werneckii]KAI7099375.1 hypothetical protein KC339_g8260 [Hortaea werneckii]KAI7204897.1 hypothetical protein KC365_g17816 [Hortaea werneckii]KAI7297068.1 hypothetical protein KC340_g15141 [Hortaea werneckii]KAI7363761.1 hypothetical protein KC354_g6231 [Hortaea werneckii]